MKGKIHYTNLGLQGMQGWFNILKINAIHFVNGIKEKNSYDHLNRCKKKLLTKFINHL